MLWVVLSTVLSCTSWPSEAEGAVQRGQGYQISPKPCFVDGVEGTCMFVYECIKSEGYHIGMCVDSFMFGSCCAHNSSTNALPAPGQAPSTYTSPNTYPRPQILYTPPSQAHKRPTSTSRPRPHHRPRPSVATAPPPPQRQTQSQDGGLAQANTINIGHYTKPHHWSGKPGASTTKHTWQQTTESLEVNSISGSSDAGLGGGGNGKPASVGWQATTEPTFVTKAKTKPSYKPTSFKPKQPTKKPIVITTVQKGGSKYTKTTTTTSTTTSTTTTTTTTTPKPKITKTRTTTTTPSPASDPVSLAPELMQTSTFSTVSAASADSSGCGQPPLFPQPQTRIVGGKNAPFGRWPWQVSVRRTSFFGFSSTHRCGGAILNENWIATAGHCVDDLLTSQIRIRVGEYDFSSVQEELPYVERSVARKVVHPKYNFFTYEYDLALVQLDKPLEFANHIRPICLPASDDLLIGENATVTGWGRLSEGGTLPSVLQEVQVPIVSNDRCKSMFLRAGRHEFIPEIFLCAGHENGGQDSCQGDSGGPLQVRGKDGRYFLAGIISWGIGCAEANLPGVCTRISKFVPWILNNVT